MTTLLSRLALLLSGILMLAGCASAPDQDMVLKSLYDRSAQYKQPDRNPVIVIPGILGSKLVETNSGQTVWGAFRADYASPKTAEGRQLIALPLDAATSNIDVRADGVLEDLELKLAGFPIRVQAYRGILTTLGAGSYRDESLGLNSIDYGDDHFTCFQFDYDWRLGMDEVAVQLDEFIEEKRAEVQYHYKQRYGIENADVKFDIVSHSMGGVLTRYYMRYGAERLPEDGSMPALTWAGAKNIDRAILVAPPNAGSLDAFDQLIDGFNTGRPILPFYDPVLIGTFPSLYQMLPRSRHRSVVWDGNEEAVIEDILDPELWQAQGWGLSATGEDSLEILRDIMPNIKTDAERQAIAKAFQAAALNKARQFHKAVDLPATPPDGVDLILVAGDASVTSSVLSYDRTDEKLDVLKDGIGDSVVLRSSALMDERVGGAWQPTLNSPIKWSKTLFLPASHRDITNSAVFEDNVLYWLLEDPR